MSNSTITAAQKSLAQNTSKQAFSVLSADVQKILRTAAEQDPSAIQYLNEDGQWRRATAPTFGANKVYRVHPDAKVANFTDMAVTVDSYGRYIANGDLLLNYLGKAKTIGFNYRDEDGDVNLETTLDIAYGTPVSVRVRV